jgi:hypothetical protein
MSADPHSAKTSIAIPGIDPVPRDGPNIKQALRKSRYFRYMLAAKRSYQRGIRLSASRYLLTSSILKTAPHPVSRCADDAELEIHILCYWRDYLQAVWALKTFYRFARVDSPLVVHIDGFITRRMRRVFTRHFPGARIVGQDESDKIAVPLLAKRGLIRTLSERTRNVFVRKMLDFNLLARGRKILVLDSDILFFGRPTDLLDATLEGSDALFMRDCSYSYTAPLGVIERIVGTPVIPYLNAGLGILNPAALDLETIEDCLQHSEVVEGDPTFLEQTLYAVGLRRSRVSHLPPSYLLSMDSGQGFRGLLARHYAGDSRELMTTEGMTHLIGQGFLAG